MTIVLTWNLHRTFDYVEKLIKGDRINTLIEYYGKDNYKRLLLDSNGDTESVLAWIEDCFIGNIHNLRMLLQILTDETTDNELVQRRLKAVGFTPKEK